LIKSLSLKITAIEFVLNTFFKNFALTSRQSGIVGT